MVASWMNGCSLDSCFFKKLVILLLWISQKLSSYFSDFEQVKNCNYFANFEQVKKVYLFCWLWTSQKINWQQNSRGKNWMPEHFFFVFLTITSCHGPSTLASQICECLHQLWALPQHEAFFECLGIQFFNSLTCNLQDVMPRQRSPTLVPREAEGFPRGDNHSKHVPLPTYLAWLQLICYNS